MALINPVALPIKWLRSMLKTDAPLYTYLPAHEIVNDYADFSGLPAEEIARCINRNTDLNKQSWKTVRANASWQEAASRFYAASDTYAFDLLSMNYSKRAILDKLNGFSPEIVRMIKDHPGSEFLEFGGGLGALCEIVLGWGKRVTYLDIPGHVMDFASWRFRKYGLPIEIIVSSPTELKLHRSFDIIYTDAVFEHLIDPHQVLVELLAHVNPGGVLILLIDLGEDPERPMHRPIDIVALHRQIREAGFLNAFGVDTFASAWVRPGSGRAAVV